MSIIKLLYTGLFGKNSNTADPKTLNIDGECSITNYDPRKGQKPGASVKVEAYNNSIFVEEGAKSDNTPDVADFSEKKAKVLEEVAALSNEDKGLSKNDILKINANNKSEYIKKWGLAGLRVDHTNFILTLEWGENDVLRIDFSKMAKERALNDQNTPEQKAQATVVKPAEEKTTQVNNNKDIPETYKVKSGETLSSIAQQYGLTISEILKLNKGLKPDKINVGQEIRLKAKVQDRNEIVKQNNVPETHKVKFGETLSNIAGQYGLTLSEILKLNKGLKPDKINVGQVINLQAPKIPKKAAGSRVNPEGVNAPVYYKGSYPTTHIIKKGQTLDTIADHYQLFTQELKDANPNFNTRSLPIGGVLNIPEPKKLKDLSDISKSGEKFLSRLRDLESRGHGYYTASNAFGYKGAYQMGKAALKDIGVYYEASGRYSNSTQKDAEWKGVFIEGNLFGITSIEDFLNNPKKQDKAIIRYMQLTWKFIEDNGMKKYVGKTIAGVKVTETGLIAACHLVGRNNVKKFLFSGGTYIPTDGNNPPTPVTKYLGDKDLMGVNHDFKL